MSIEAPASHAQLNGIPLTPIGLDEAFEWVIDRSEQPGPLSIVATVNVQLLRTARTNAAFAAVLRERTAMNLVDGWLVAWLRRRAPSWMRRNGREWLHRASLEPVRVLPRYVRDASELARLLATG